MGFKFCGGRSSSSYDRQPPTPSLPNPNPNNYTIENYLEKGNYLIIMVKYHDCTNYEGKKILVYKNVSLLKLLKQRSIDPHFSKSQTYLSPIARFVPTTEGWNMAQRFVNGES